MPAEPVVVIGLCKANFQRLVFCNVARDEQLVRASEVMRIGSGCRIDADENAGAAPAEFCVASELHFCRNGAFPVFGGNILRRKPRLDDACAFNRTAFRIAPAPGIKTEQIGRIGGRFQFRAILFRKEDNQKALRRNDRVSERPLAGFAFGIRKRKAFQVHRGIGRVEKFNPIGMVAVFIFERRIFGIDFGKDDGGCTQKIAGGRIVSGRR